MTRCGADNPNWRGGTSVTHDGYVLVRVGVEHHLADVRGYAYEHRLVAEEVIGRRLRPGEIVHHVNGDATDNRPENIRVMASRKHHAAKHRKRSDLRGPDEPNRRVLCGCGCGQSFLKYDSVGRPRVYLPGHNLRRRHGRTM